METIKTATGKASRYLSYTLPSGHIAVAKEIKGYMYAVVYAPASEITIDKLNAIPARDWKPFNTSSLTHC